MWRALWKLTGRTPSMQSNHLLNIHLQTIYLQKKDKIFEVLLVDVQVVFFVLREVAVFLNNLLYFFQVVFFQDSKGLWAGERVCGGGRGL